MNGSSESAVSDRNGAFLERIRRALAHDLRTPLGTIANYAAILEYHGDAKPADVRVFAGRIRQSAVRAAVMLQHMTDALVLSERQPSEATTDPAGLIRALISEMAVHARFPARGEEPPSRLPVDSDLLAFTWRAFLAVNAEAAGDSALDLDIEIGDTDDPITLDLWVGARPPETPARVGSTKFFESTVEVNQPESCFALALAEELIRLRGGEMGLWGRPGQASSLRVSFPARR